VARIIFAYLLLTSLATAAFAATNATRERAVLAQLAGARFARVQRVQLARKELNQEIARLDAAHAAKLAESTTLHSQLVQRKEQISQNYQRTRTAGILGALLGAPMVGVLSLVHMQNDDARVQELNGKIAAAKTEMDQIQIQLADYRRMKAQAGYK
jgi:hypothetical protein